MLVNVTQTLRDAFVKSRKTRRQKLWRSLGDRPTVVELSRRFQFRWLSLFVKTIPNHRCLFTTI